MSEEGFLTEGGAFDVQKFKEYISSNSNADSVNACPTGMNNNGHPEFRVKLKYREFEAGQEVIGDAALSLPEGYSLTASRVDTGVVTFAVFEEK